MEPLARVKSIAVSGCAPEVMGLGPVGASRKALERAGIGAGDVDVVELNEAFAAQAIACMRDLGLEHEKVNLDGGADRARASAGGHRRADHRQGGGASQARGRALRPRHPVHRRRAGDRHGAGGGGLNAIERVAVIGSGVMGGGIAAHLANAGASVLLLDVAAKDGPDRSAVARAAVARLAKSAPPAFMHRRAAGRIDAGNLEDDLSRAGEADWIVEAVVERLDVKRDLYARLDAVRKPGAIVSSNTSTIPLARLTEGASAALQRDFAITHFFNPPRYMRLLEIVRGPATRPELVDQLRDFADRRLGKGVVECKDTPGFIANRIGVFWLQCALIEAIEAGAWAWSRRMRRWGRPRGSRRPGCSGSSTSGLDLMPHVAGSMDALLPPGDALRRYMEVPEVLRRMVAGGYTGRKGKGGFYRLRREGGERIKESIDLATGEYRRSERARLACVEAAKAGGARALVEHDSEEGRYAWRVLSSVLAYSASLVPEISDDVAGVDAAMRLGYKLARGTLRAGGSTRPRPARGSAPRRGPAGALAAGGGARGRLLPRGRRAYRADPRHRDRPSSGLALLRQVPPRLSLAGLALPRQVPRKSAPPGQALPGLILLRQALPGLAPPESTPPGPVQPVLTLAGSTLPGRVPPKSAPPGPTPPAAMSPSSRRLESYGSPT